MTTPTTTPPRYTVEIFSLIWQENISSPARPDMISAIHAFGDAYIWRRHLGGYAYEFNDDRGPTAITKGTCTTIDECKAACDMLNRQNMHQFLIPYIVPDAPQEAR